MERISEETREKNQMEMFDDIIDKLNEIIDWINSQ
tara:strand:+ start:642 stop:746 length:105 start_codon:yes stop_codon:yes gene_type:complete